MDTTVYIALVIALITTAAVLIISIHSGQAISVGSGSKKRVTSSPIFIIAGPSGSGKTSLFNLLTTGEPGKTVASQVASFSDSFMLPSGVEKFKFALIDFPGHVKLRQELFTTLQSSNNIRGVIYMVDSTVDPKRVTETAEFLYDVLSITERKSQAIDIMIACNKSESFTSRPPLMIKDALEKELGQIIERKSKDLRGAGEDDLTTVFATSGAAFKLDHLEAVVQVCAGSVLSKDIDAWQAWLDENAIN
ncbi:AaceriACR063Cp [[Ashbya] aceris (nom. inval.)]|nr:AaceriACR063Cp [[Ashbya] aceris (nom. inval.)]